MDILVLPTESFSGLPIDGADVIWLNDQPSPFGIEPPRLYEAVGLYTRSNAPVVEHALRYRATLVTGKDGPAGSIQLLAFIERREGQSREDAFRHWDEHIPLAVDVHHRALRYRQFRINERLSTAGPDYVGLAVLDFAGPEEMRTGIYRTQEDVETIAKDIADFVERSDTFYGSEHAA